MQEKNEICVRFSLRLAEALKQANIKQKELARVLNISEQTICKYKRGNRLPDSEELYKLAKFFGVTIDWLLGGEESGSETFWKERALTAEAKLAGMSNLITLLEELRVKMSKAASSG